MKKILKGLLMSITMLVSMPSLTGCFGFGGESLAIESITTQKQENGDTVVVITYADGYTDPTIFTIPAGQNGENGQDGNGIKDITYKKSETGVNTIVTITFTNERNEPVEIIIPNGVSITSVDSVTDPNTGNTLLTVNYSDGSKTERIEVAKGEPGIDGKDGNGIEKIDQVLNADKSITLTIVMTSGEEVKVDIPAPERGDEGRGIKDIVSVPNGDTYIMTITFSDGAKQELEFARPNKWFSESGEPQDTDGIDGDLWYDLAHQTIYVKEQGVWNTVLNLGEEVNVTYQVSFELNDSYRAPAKLPLGSFSTYNIPSGKYFQATGYTLPVPTRTGYVFEGWYTSKTINAATGKFTDLTPVMSDLTLYASWSIEPTKN